MPRILLPATIAMLVLDYAKRHLAANVSDAMEREMQAWDARWRAEALDHYLALGWSFGIFRGAALERLCRSASPCCFFAA